MSELKILCCPFCGSDPAMETVGERALLFCGAPKCPVQPRANQFHPSLEEAVEAWNTRHTSEEPTGFARLLKTAWIVRFKVAKINDSYDVCRVLADSKCDAQHQVLSRKDVHVTWASATPWDELDQLRDTSPKVDEQLEKDIECLRFNAQIGSAFDGAVARTILHLLKR